MADFNQPVLTTDYTTLLDALKARDVDAISLAESPTNPASGFLRYNRSLNKFQEWNGSAWVDKVISLAGGGTGGTDAATARTALGLGTIAVQNSNAITITGGSISGLSAFSVSGDSTLSGRLDVGSTSANAIDVAGGITAGSGNVAIINTAGKIPEFSSTYFSSMTVPSNAIFTGTVITFTGIISIETTAPQLVLKDTDSATDEKYYRFIANGGSLFLQSLNDAFGGAIDIVTINRSGVNPTLITFAPAATFNGNVTVSGGISCTTFASAAGLSITSGAASEVNLKASGTLGFRVGPGYFTHYDDATLGQAIIFATSNYVLTISSKAMGTGAIAGPAIGIGRNSSGGGAPGTLCLVDKGGTNRFLWVDSTGKLRIGTTAPTETGTADTTGTVVGTQT